MKNWEKKIFFFNSTISLIVYTLNNNNKNINNNNNLNMNQLIFKVGEE